MKKEKLYRCYNCKYKNPANAVNCAGCGTVSPSANAVKQSKKYKLLLFSFVILFVLASLFIPNRAPVETVPAKVLSEKEIQARWLEFDNQSWEQFVSLYSSHNNLMDAMAQYSNGNASKIDFYDFCKESNEYFSDTMTAFEYGENEEERKYLGGFQTMAYEDYAATKSLLKYLNNGNVSDLSKAGTHIETAKQAAVMIASNRGVLLVSAGLTDEEIQVKVKEDMNDFS